MGKRGKYLWSSRVTLMRAVAAMKRSMRERSSCKSSTKSVMPPFGKEKGNVGKIEESAIDK